MNKSLALKNAKEKINSKTNSNRIEKLLLAALLAGTLTFHACSTMPLPPREKPDSKTKTEWNATPELPLRISGNSGALRTVVLAAVREISDGLPGLMALMQEHGMEIVIKKFPNDALAAYSLANPNTIEFNLNTEQIIEKCKKDGLYPQDMTNGEIIKNAITHEFVHALQDRAGLMADIENICPSEYVDPANFMELDAGVKAQILLDPETFADIERRDQLLLDSIRNWREYFQGYTLVNYQRAAGYNNPDGREITPRDIVLRGSNLPGVPGYSVPPEEILSKMSHYREIYAGLQNFYIVINQDKDDEAFQKKFLAAQKKRETETKRILGRMRRKSMSK